MAGMEQDESESRTQIGPVKAAISLYGEKMLRGNSPRNTTQLDFPELPLKVKELHLARTDIGRFNERRNFAETLKAEAESELLNARKRVKDLSLKIEQSNAKANARKKEVYRLKEPERQEGEWALAIGQSSNHQYTDVMRELELVKQELVKLKLDMASVLESKLQAERQASSSVSQVRSYSSSIEALRKEIEETNEEEVLVELARMEAVRELGEIEAQREAEAAQFSVDMENARKRIDNLNEEMSHLKKLETKLEITNSDINVLENELKLVNTLEQNMEQSLTHSFNPINYLAQEIERRRKEEMESAAILESALAELSKAKKELHTIRDEGFQFMASMDVIREELKHVSTETARLTKFQEKSDATVHNLNSKLLRAKSKLEAAGAAEKKSWSILSNLKATLEQLETEKEAVKKAKELISEETLSITQEIQKTESEIELQEEKLEAAMQELETVKRSEEIALESLKTYSEKTMQARTLSSLTNSTITVSKFEYEYLTSRAKAAEEIADKKVAAAQAWIEALKASEKEILLKTKTTQREIKELREVEEQELSKREKALTARRAVQSEVSHWRQLDKEKEPEEENLPLEVALTTKAMIDNGNPMTPRRTKIRRPASPGFRYLGRTNSIALRKKRKGMPTLVKLFSGRKAGKLE